MAEDHAERVAQVQAYTKDMPWVKDEEEWNSLTQQERDNYLKRKGERQAGNKEKWNV